MDSDIRWQQRFDNFEKAYLLLQEAAKIENPSLTEQAGLLQFFEMSIELAWKTLKDYLSKEQFQVVSPRETVKQAFQSHLIDNGELWLRALNDRNLIAHTYDQQVVSEIVQRVIGDYVPMLENSYTFMKQKYAK